MVELKDIGERLTSIVSVEHYALGLLKMLETQTQKDIASYVGVSQSKLSHIVQLLSDIHSYTPCVIVRYISCVDNDVTKYYMITDNRWIDYSYYTLIDIFKFSVEEYNKLVMDIAIEISGIDFVDSQNLNWIKVDKLSQITIDALHSLEYRYKA